MPLLIAASADNGCTRITPDNNGPKTLTKSRIKTKHDDMILTTKTIITRVKYISPDATRWHPVAHNPVTLLRHHYHHQHRHIIIIVQTTSAHHQHQHQQLRPATSNAGNLTRVHNLLGCQSDLGRLLCVLGGGAQTLCVFYSSHQHQRFMFQKSISLIYSAIDSAKV